MKYLKKFEKNYDYNSDYTFLVEFDLEKKIINFIKYNNLKYVDNIKIYNEIYYITLGKVGNYNDTLLKYKYTGDEPKEIMIGIPRNKGINIYTNIMNQINKLNKDDIEVLHTKQASSKFNI